jgi:putative endonuclease
LAPVRFTVSPFGGYVDVTRERLELGKKGENLALKTIRSMGYKDILQNYRCPLGEIDLIARDGDTLVFLEIKTRRTGSTGYAKEAVNARKRHQISKAALAYMKANNCGNIRARFDVVAISLAGPSPKIEVIKNAFDLAY